MIARARHRRSAANGIIGRSLELAALPPRPETGIAGVAPLCPTFSFFPGRFKIWSSWMFHPSAPLVCMLAQRCGKKNRRASAKNDPARHTWVGVRPCEVETCEARGLGGGLRARYPRWDTILCMSAKRPSTKKQRSSPNPSSASDAEVGARFQARGWWSEIFAGNARAPGFFAGDRLEASIPIDPP